jgi:hypothetical protein
MAQQTTVNRATTPKRPTETPPERAQERHHRAPSKPPQKCGGNRYNYIDIFLSNGANCSSFFFLLFINL